MSLICKDYQLRAAQNEIKTNNNPMHQHLSPSLRRTRGKKPIKNEIHYRTISRGRNWTSNEAVKVSDAIAKKFNHEIIWTPALTGACAIDAVGVP
jgi:hypothetical protein